MRGTGGGGLLLGIVTVGEIQSRPDLLSRGTSFRFRHWQYEGTKTCGARIMLRRRKKIEPTDWSSTMEQIGRELGKIYRQPKRLPRRLRALVTQLERKIPVRRGRQ